MSPNSVQRFWDNDMRQIKTWRSAAAELQDEILGVDDSGAQRCRRAGIPAGFLDGFRRLRHAEGADRACRALQSMRGCADTDGFTAGNILRQARAWRANI